MPRLLALILALGAWPALAHEGHDHGAPPPPVTATIAPRADASSDLFELVAVARGTRLVVTLDRFRDNAPIGDAAIELDGPGGTAKLPPDGAGGYAIDAPWLAKPGRHDLAFTVQAGGDVEVLTATLVVPPPELASAGARPDMARRLGDPVLWLAAALAFAAGAGLAAVALRRRPVAMAVALLTLAAVAPESARADDARSADRVATRDIAQRFPDGALFVPKSTQRILGIRTLFAEGALHPGTVELPGRVIPDPDGSGVVQAAIAGRLAPPAGGFPRLGTRVAAGDVLAYVQPAVGAADSTIQQQQARELDQQIALAERRLERLRQVQNIVARAQIEDIELELNGLRVRRANLDRRERENLVAPVAGVIASVQAVAGQMAEPNAVIFRIVDPARFWVEALAYDAQALGARATGRLAGGRTLALAYRGTGLADRNQAIPIHFEVEGDGAGLHAGQLLSVLAPTAEERRGIAVPRAAVLRGANGQAIVYEHSNAERFVPREVRIEPLDGDRVLIVSGLEPRRRVVTQGAELLNQIR